MQLNVIMLALLTVAAGMIGGLIYRGTECFMLVARGYRDAMLADREQQRQHAQKKHDASLARIRERVAVMNNHPVVAAAGRAHRAFNNLGRALGAEGVPRGEPRSESLRGGTPDGKPGGSGSAVPGTR